MMTAGVVKLSINNTVDQWQTVTETRRDTVRQRCRCRTSTETYGRCSKTGICLCGGRIVTVNETYRYSVVTLTPNKKHALLHVSGVQDTRISW